MTSLYITEAGAYLHKRGGHVVVGRNQEVILEVPLEKVEDVYLIDSVQISSSLMVEFIKREIPLSWLSTRGTFYGSLINTSFVDVMKHLQQVRLLEEKLFYLSLSKKLIVAKINNQLTILRRYNRTIESRTIEQAIGNIISVRKSLLRSHTSNELIGYEGLISRLYFQCLGEIVPEPFTFTKRSKHPPLDSVNSLLSLGYSMLFNEILAGVIATGLHPYIGCLHKPKKGHAALVSDLIEEWRAPIIDSMVLSMLKRNMIGYDQFLMEEDGCYLSPEARKIFLLAYNQKIKSSNKYFGTDMTYRACIKKQIAAYSRAVMNECVGDYQPVELR